MKLHLTTLLLFISITVTYSQADRWRLLTTSENDNKYYYDQETLEKDSVSVTFWLKTVKPNNKESAKSLQQINCLNKQMRENQIVYYDDNGNVTRSYDSPSKWSGIIPETIGERMYKVFCKNDKDAQYYKNLNDNDDLLEKAYKLQSEEKYPAAISIFNSIIKTDPQNLAALNGKANALIQSKQLPLAKTLLFNNLKIDPNDGYTNFLLAELSEKEKSLSLARKYYWRSIQAADYPLASLWFQMFLENQKDFVGLSDLYIFLIKNGEIHYYDDLSNNYKRQNLKLKSNLALSNGIKAFESKLLTDELKDFEINSYAELYSLQGNYNKSTDILSQAVKHYPKSGLIAVSYADILNEQGMWSVAINAAYNSLSEIDAKYYKTSLLRIILKAYKSMNDSVNAERVQKQISDLESEK